jgi:hypothetical protein
LTLTLTTTTRRPGSVFALWAIFAVGGAGVARAQAPQAAATPLPLAIDLRKVPVGSWSEYSIADGKSVVAVRLALVARSASPATVETEIKGGATAALGRTIMRMSIPIVDAVEVRPQDQVIQLGDNPPMSLPGEMGGMRTAQTFRKLDAKKRIGVDAVTVPGGAFPRAERYRDKGAAGETVDFWISKNIMPFGLVKVTSSGLSNGTTVTMDLTAHGAGAKAVITKTPQPFDVEAIMKQAQPAVRPGDVGVAAGSSGGGPPARPIPSPHPGMPATQPGATPRSPAGKNPPGGATVQPSGAAASSVPSAHPAPAAAP